MKLFSALSAFVFVPLLLSATASPSLSSGSSGSIKGTRSSAVATKVQAVSLEERIVHRKIRIEKLLISLDQAASVVIQMHPVNSQRIEPVIVDLAEQTLSLVGVSELQSVKTDSELDRLEATVGRLVNAMNKMIEPEMSL